MGIAIQYDLFEEKNELNEIKKELRAIRESGNSVRKGTYASLSDLRRMIMHQHNEIESLKSQLVQSRR